MNVIALISIRAAGEVNLLTSTVVDAGSGSLKYSMHCFAMAVLIARRSVIRQAR